jgi:hypothetical protein
MTATETTTTFIHGRVPQRGDMRSGRLGGSEMSSQQMPTIESMTVSSASADDLLIRNPPTFIKKILSPTIYACTPCERE